MASNIFISFRFDDGINYKRKLEELFDDERELLNRSEKIDRSECSEETIQKYLYKLIKRTTITIVILTPNAVEYRKGALGYDDWLYDELSYSLQHREENTTNGVIALYTREAKDKLFKTGTHKCNVCNKEQNINTILHFDNLVRKNMMNIKGSFKKNPCPGVYDSDYDSYISLVAFEEFVDNPMYYIDKALEKRNNKYQYELVKRMNNN